MSSRTTVVQDTWTLTVRMLKHNIRSSDTIMTVLATPVMMLLAFVFVLGGAMDTGPTRYVDYVVPVVALFCIVSGVAYTAFRVNQDVIKGVYARFRTMPVARTAMVAGHIVASVIVNGVSVAILFGIAFGVGYRPSASLVEWGVTIGLLVVALLAFSVMGVSFGLAAKTDEGASMFMYFAIGLLFVSSGFAPTDTMPSPVQAFADHQPMTPIINAIRDTQLGHMDGVGVLIAFGWLAAMVVVFSLLAGTAGKRGTSRSL